MNLYNHIKSVLSENEAFCKDGQLFKNSVVEAGLKLDSELLKLLLKDQKAKKHFFTDVDDIAVFDKAKFQKFVSNKQFLPDSFTAFKNKIGLTANGEYLTEANEVVLDFPYKDCVLEGGQTKEDQNRQELFWNETLAPDEIDRLFEPKVFTNWKRINSDGESAAVDVFKNDSLLLKGNNLLVLHSLLPKFKSKVKLIYIDPPFNTGNDSFQYNDRFNHSTWLTFMQNRLSVAKEYLSNDGAIFINVDDIEEGYLKVLCDSIFGRENFVNVITVKSSTPSGTKTAHKDKTIIKQKDLILVYRKSKSTKFYPQYTVREKWDKHYSLYLDKDENGNHTLRRLTDVLIENNIISKKIPLDKLNLDDKVFKKFYLSNAENICRLQSHKNKEADKLSRKLKDQIYEHIVDGVSYGLYYNGQFITPLKQGIHKVYKNQSFSDDLGMLLCDFWWDIDYQNTQNEGGVSFPTAKKPEALIARIINLVTNEGDIVLDYHLGSGTTAAVAHKMNRRFIGIEQLDYGENDSLKRLENVISGEQSGISKAFNWEGGGSFIYAELAKRNNNLIDKITSAKEIDDLLYLISEIKSSDFIKFNIDLALSNEEVEDFKQLDIELQRQVLIDLIDKNQFYIGVNEIEDIDLKIDDVTKSLNQKFYS